MDIVKVFGNNLRKYRNELGHITRGLCREVRAAQNIYQCY